MADSETFEQRAVRLLTLLANSVEPVSSDETWLLVDLAVLAELAENGYIRAGDIVRNGMGQVCAIGFMTITISGRGYLAELQKKTAFESFEHEMADDGTSHKKSGGQPEQITSANKHSSVQSYLSDDIFKVLGIVAIVAWMVSEFLPDPRKYFLLVAIAAGLGEAAYVLGHKILRHWAGIILCWCAYAVCIYAIFNKRQPPPEPKPPAEKYDVLLNTPDSPDLNLWLTNAFLQFSNPVEMTPTNVSGYLIIPTASTNTIPALKFTVYNKSETQITQTTVILSIGTEINFDAPQWTPFDRLSDNKWKTVDVKQETGPLTRGLGQQLSDVMLKTADLRTFGRVFVQIIPPDRQDAFLGFWVGFIQVSDKGHNPFLLRGTNGVVKFSIGDGK